VIKNITELKEIIKWAKAQKVKTLSIGTIQFEISELAFIEDQPDLSNVDLSELVDVQSQELKTLGDAAQLDEEETLYWSSN